jgi:hypothetical protein
MVLLLALAVGPAWAHAPRESAPRPEPRVDPPAAVPRSAAVMRPPDVGREMAGLVRRAARARSPVGLAEVIGVLTLAGGLAGLGGASRRDRGTALAAVTAALVLGFVVETTPHLAHHALDPDKGAGCQVLQTIERTQVSLVALDATPAPERALLVAVPSPATAPSLMVRAPRGRAPPA